MLDLHFDFVTRSEETKMTATGKLTPRGLIGIAVALVLATPVLAHHGWGWTRAEWFELDGTITAVYVGQPHVTLTVMADGAEWDVDLAPLSRSIAAGFDEAAAEVGDQATLIGHRAIEEAETHIKAVRVIVNGAVYDVYPNRAASYDREG